MVACLRSEGAALKRWYLLVKDTGNIPVSEFTADVDTGELLPTKVGHHVVQAPWTGTERPNNYRWNETADAYETYTPGPDLVLDTSAAENIAALERMVRECAVEVQDFDKASTILGELRTAETDTDEAARLGVLAAEASARSVVSRSRLQEAATALKAANDA